MAAATSTDVVNEALALIGYDGFPVTGFAPNFDGSAPGKVAARVYAPAVAAVSRINTWSFPRTVAVLALTGNTAPFPWAFEYVFPANCVDVWQLLPTPPVRPVTHTIQKSANSGFFDGVTTVINMVEPNFSEIFPGWGVTDLDVGSQSLGTVFSYVGSVLTLTAPSLITCAGSNDILDFVNPVVPPFTPFDFNNPVPYTMVRGIAVVGSVQSSVIWANLDNALAVFNSNPLESTWDPLFRAAVVSYLAAEFGIADLGKPDLAELYMERWKQLIPAAAARTDQ